MSGQYPLFSWLSRLFNFLGASTLSISVSSKSWASAACIRQLYIAFVEACFTYGAAVYMPFVDTSELEELHGSAAILMLGLPSSAHRGTALEHAGLRPLEDIIRYECAVLVAKAFSRHPEDPLRQAVDLKSSEGWAIMGRGCIAAARIRQF